MVIPMKRLVKKRLVPFSVKIWNRKITLPVGIKIKYPTMIASIADTNTAPAAMSLILPARAFRCGQTKSTSPSIAELKSSATTTIPQNVHWLHYAVVLW